MIHKKINFNKVVCGSKKISNMASEDNLVTCTKCLAVIAKNKITKFKHDKRTTQ